MQALDGIAAADARLGRPFPLPAAPVPLPRWVEVRTVDDGVEVEWNLDDSRRGAPGRLALFAGPTRAGSQLPADAQSTTAANGMTVRRAALPEAQRSLRPVVEVAWEAGGLHLRLTAQGPWELSDVLALATSVSAPDDGLA
jgi:hypothetical protein